MTGTELSRIRTQLEMTQAELARRIGRHANTVAQYERGVYPIPTAVALAIQMVMGNTKRKKGK